MTLNRSQLYAGLLNNTAWKILPSNIRDIVNNAVLPEDLIAGTNVTLDKSSLPTIIINATGGGGGLTNPLSSDLSAGGHNITDIGLIPLSLTSFNEPVFGDLVAQITTGSSADNALELYSGSFFLSCPATSNGVYLNFVDNRDNTTWGAMYYSEAGQYFSLNSFNSGGSLGDIRFGNDGGVNLGFNMPYVGGYAYNTYGLGDNGYALVIDTTSNIWTGSTGTSYGAIFMPVHYDDAVNTDLGGSTIWASPGFGSVIKISYDGSYWHFGDEYVQIMMDGAFYFDYISLRGVSTGTITVTSGYAVQPYDDIILVTQASGSPINIYLPNPTSIPCGKTYTIKNIYSTMLFATTIFGGGGSIDNASSVVLGSVNQFDFLTVVGDGSNYWIVASSGDLGII
jgi:hypothetical protein